MSNYTKTTNFATKDALASGNPAKIVKGTEIDTEFNNIAVASGTKADKASPTFTGTVTLPITNVATSLSIGGDGVTVTGIKDEDDMASNSATKLASQQSIKAYVDAQVTAQDLDVTDGTTSISIDLDSEALSLLGGTGITSTASGNGVTLAINSTVATLSGSQTLTNKTLAAPAVTGALTTNSTLDGRDVSVDGTKLDTVETNADVTDTTNVTAAGALMDSEVTNLAQVKAFDSTDYATAAQGTTADAALPKAGGAMTGAITTNSTFDGRDVATDGTKLDGIEALADVTDTANVTAAGALMDSELTSEASVKALNQGVATTDSPAFAGIDVTGTATMDSLVVEQNTGSTITLKSTDTAINAGEVIGDIEFYSADASGVGAANRANITVQAEDSAGRGSMYFKTSTGGESPLNRALIQGNGDISFYEDTGTTAKFFWDASAESLGIGTSSPSETLAVESTSNNAILLNSPANRYNAVGFQSAGVDKWWMGRADTDVIAGDAFFIGADAGNATDAGGTSAKLVIDSSGNVGIGTSSPASTLEIAKNDQTNGATLSITNSFDGGSWTAGDTIGTVDFRVDDGSTTQKVRGQIKVFEDTATGSSTYPFANAMSFSTGYFDNLNERMRIDSSGNVGIGASSPAGKLDVLAGSDQRLLFTTLGTDPFISAVNGANSAYKLLQLNGSEMRLMTGGAERMRIDSSGNMGIGTSSPKTSLSIETSGTQDVVSPVVTGQTAGVTYGGLYTVRDGAGDQRGLDLKVYTANVGLNTAMRIDSSGNVGIGTSSPAYKLNVAGDMIADGDGNSRAIGFDFYGALKYNLYTDGSTDADKMHIRKGTTNVATFDSSGKVGIGTDSPATVLSIHDSADKASLTQTNTANTQKLEMGNAYSLYTGGSGAISAVASDLVLAFATADTEAMRIDSSGNLLVGKTSSGSNIEGVELIPQGAIYAVRNNNVTGVFNRKSTDGDIVNFRKDGISVGSIGTNSSDLYIGKDASGLLFDVTGADGIRPFNTTTQSETDNTLDLGSTSSRFKDLYLSGGVYLGGTGAANKLDDYESGTYTADLYENGGSTLDVVTGRYTKIGNVCTVSVQSLGGTTGGAGVVRSNLPFAIDGSSSGSSVLAYSVSNGGMLSVLGFGGTSYVEFVDTLGSIATGNKMLGSDVTTNSRTYFTLTYKTA